MECVNIEALKILNEYPLLVPYSNFKKWEGFIQVKEMDVHIEITAPFYPSLRDISIKCPPDVYPLLISLTNQAEDSSLLNLLRSVSHALKSKSLIAVESLEIDKQKLKTFIIVLKELKTMGSTNVVNLNHDAMTVTLRYDDSNGNSHDIIAQFDGDYPKTAVIIKKIDLPIETVHLLEGSATLKQLYESFKEKVEDLIPFWESAKELENECWVIDPEVPQCKDTYRRIFLTTDLSVSISFNTLRMHEMPEIKFFGCVSVVEQKSSEYMSRLEAIGWDMKLSLVSNLRRLLAIEEFPRKCLNSTQDPLECIICATSCVEDGAPAQKWCNNDKCPSVYHRSCLYRWFDGLQSAKQYWDYICGPCPYCKVKIWCPIKEDIPAKRS
uniref:E3 ubiquitin-protein ligase FANCL n=2 Tax=Lygus hesperus TaxID=30085 RepID=A0A0A9XU31_LYGHE